MSTTMIEKATLTALSADYSVRPTFEVGIYEVREGNGAVRIVTVNFAAQVCKCTSRSGQTCDQYARSGACRHVAAVMFEVAKTIGLPVLPVPATKPLPQPSRVGRAPQWYGVGKYSSGF